MIVESDLDVLYIFFSCGQDDEENYAVKEMEEN